MRNKQTAVEWLYDTIIIFPESIEDLAHNARSFKQAKQMEKEQIKDAFTDGCIGELYELNAYYTSEKYYTQTYGK